jgi:hypothetical protein
VLGALKSGYLIRRQQDVPVAASDVVGYSTQKSVNYVVDAPSSPPSDGGSPGGSTTPAGGGGPGADAGPGASVAALDQALQALLRGKVPTVKALLKSGNASVRFTAPAAGTLTLEWTTGQGATARTAVRRAVVAKGTRMVSAAGGTTVTVKLTAAGRKLLKRTRKRLKISATASFRATDGMTAKQRRR